MPKCSKCKTEKEMYLFHKSELLERDYKMRCKQCIKEKRDEIFRSLLRDKERERNDKYKLERKWSRKVINGHKSKYEVNLTVEELIELAIKIKNCPLCGILLNYGNKKNKRWNSASLDRINNEKHLNIKNVFILCTKCNATKSDRRMNDFHKLCERIALIKINTLKSSYYLNKEYENEQDHSQQSVLTRQSNHHGLHSVFQHWSDPIERKEPPMSSM